MNHFLRTLTCVLGGTEVVMGGPLLLTSVCVV